jgi:ADP-ribose pyrophosphatase YjhB (NUDIX family)
MPGAPGQAFRYCPSCGSDARIDRGGKSLRCGACGFQFFFNAAGAVAALIRHESGLLMTLRGREPGKDLLDLPGGFVDPGESAEQALHREVREELGISLREAVYFTSCPNTYRYGGVTYNTLDLAFICASEELSRIRPADDVASSIIVPLDDIDYDRIAFESVRYFIRSFARRYAETGR